MSFFNKYLTIWVVLCIGIGILIGKFIPVVPHILGELEYAHISIPITVLIWVMIYPMMLKVDFQSVRNVARQPKGIIITSTVNWLVKPFTMFGIVWFFLLVVFKSWIPVPLAKEYLAGATLLGAAPCTAMVFVWSSLSKGNPTYTLMQVALNDLIILVAYVPIVTLLLGVSGMKIPYDTLFLSVVLFIVLPLLAGIITRRVVLNRKGMDDFEQFSHRFDKYTTVGLLAMLIILFSFQGKTILNNPLHIILIAVPLVIQTYLNFTITYGWAHAWHLPYEIAAPAGMIGGSNFFELAVAVAISLFGLQSGAALATTVGVLTEVPIMLSLVRIAKSAESRFASSR